MSPVDTWKGAVPSGYMYGNQWVSLQCSITFIRTKQQYEQCLKDIPLLLIGDSTTRIFFVQVMNYLNLSFNTAGLNVLDGKSWQRNVHASAPERGLHIEWMPHEHPYASEGFRRNMHSVSSRLSEIGSNREAIILIHWYLHFARYLTPELYRLHVKNAVVAIKHLIQRSPKVKVLLKGPHSHTYARTMVPYDVVRKYMEQIIYEEFKDIQESVYYINYWDMTLGIENVMPHPTDHINDIMIHNFLSFVCPG